MYKRILLKISGESIADKEKNQTLNTEKINVIANEIKKMHDKGVEVAVVIGAGNIWRGKFASQVGIDPAEADYMGMLGTVINSVALSSALKNVGVNAVSMSAIHVPPVTLEFNEEEANRILAEKTVIVFGGGTGKPFFTTDTAATLRAIQIKADTILMAKYGIDGVYTSDPNIDKDAKFLSHLTYQEVLDKELKVMDQSAIELILDHDIDLHVFNMNDPKNISRVVNGENIGTIISKK